ncbi:MAG: hypothetical protein WC302_01055 [Candidatus Paceibacterota bacterium]|jgi:hypothetical protein
MRKVLGETVFFFHIIFGIFWYSLFLVPETVFPDRVSFHFYLSLLVVFHQFVWGFLIWPWTRKYRMVCILTTITQALKGESLSDPKNYDHSFSRELFGKMGIRISNRTSTYLTFLIFTLASLQYALSFRG